MGKSLVHGSCKKGRLEGSSAGFSLHINHILLNIFLKAAIKINKEFKQPKYYFWMAVSIYLQALEPDAKNGKVLLSLAEKMMAKALLDGKITDFESNCLYSLS